MHGPDSRGPTFLRRLITAVIVVVSVVLLLGMSFVLVLYDAIRKDGAPRHYLLGDTRQLPAHSEAREGATPRAGTAGRDGGARDGVERADAERGATIDQALSLIHI